MLVDVMDMIVETKNIFTKRIYSLSHISYPERLAAINLESIELSRLKNDLVNKRKPSDVDLRYTNSTCSLILYN